MKVSTRTHYGLRLMSYLACHHGEPPVSVREIAEEQGLPTKYLEQLCAALKAAGLIEAVRGAGGGYVLARDPGQIKMWDIYEVLEGELTSVSCLHGPHLCSNEKTCPTREMWLQMTEAMKQVLEQSTLAQFATENRCSCLGRGE
ncbi:MAG: RrF2 family transcriptional regulator [Bacteroidota bacterium]